MVAKISLEMLFLIPSIDQTCERQLNVTSREIKKKMKFNHLIGHGRKLVSFFLALLDHTVSNHLPPSGPPSWFQSNWLKQQQFITTDWSTSKLVQSTSLVLLLYHLDAPVIRMAGPIIWTDHPRPQWTSATLTSHTLNLLPVSSGLCLSRSDPATEDLIFIFVTSQYECRRFLERHEIDLKRNQCY